MSTTKIEWATRVWNPVTGCTKVSPGCANCYAERFAKRLQANPKVNGKYVDGFAVTCHHDELTKPMLWKKPERVFVCSMGDLFHDDVPFDFISAVFSVMSDHDEHNYIVLTKRPERMFEFYKWKRELLGHSWSAKENVWIGVSAENQEQADKRIPVLLRIPSKIHLVSCEPLLSEISLNEYYFKTEKGFYPFPAVPENDRTKWIDLLNWVIAGGETGHKARPMHPDWVRSIRDQCKAANVPFFFKGWGEWIDNQNSNSCDISLGKFLDSPKHTFGSGYTSTDVNRLGKKCTGRMLDGVEYSEFPKA